MKKIILLTLLCLPLMGPSLGQAKEAEYIGGSPEMQARVMSVSEELRCLVCQGQSLGDSNSEFAIDMRAQILEMMEGGMSERQVVDFMVERYGDYVRYRPPLKASTILLWFGPFLLLIIGGGILYFNVLRRRKQIVDTPLSEKDHRRAEALLRGDAETKSGEDKA